ncbi:MAG: hypothetical protein HC933_04945 [Pleurocapsa sp. SU_196_0]|nr:hypothetical protein [Pleurocapsa sp. SU_196_0]
MHSNRGTRDLQRPTTRETLRLTWFTRGLRWFDLPWIARGWWFVLVVRGLSGEWNRARGR